MRVKLVLRQRWNKLKTNINKSIFSLHKGGTEFDGVPGAGLQSPLPAAGGLDGAALAQGGVFRLGYLDIVMEEVGPALLPAVHPGHQDPAQPPHSG